MPARVPAAARAAPVPALMLATAPALRRALVAALFALLALWAVWWFPWGGASDAVSGSPADVAAPAAVVVRQPVAVDEPGPAPPTAAPPSPAPAELAAPDTPVEPAAGERRAVGERHTAASGRLRVACDIQNALLYVGRGGSLPLDAPAAPAAAALSSGGYVRLCGGAPAGIWEVDRLPPGPLRVLIAGPSSERVDVDDLWVLAGETLDLGHVPQPSSQAFEFTVLGPDGLPVRDARVGLIGDRPGGARDALGLGAAIPLGVTDAAGRREVRLREGPWRLRVVAAGLAPFTLAGHAVPGDGTRAIAIEMTAGGVVAGDVYDPDQLGFRELQIAGWNPAAPGPTPRDALASGLPVDALATVFGAPVDAVGRFHADGLPADSVWHLRALVESDLSQDDAFAPLATARAGERSVVVEQRAGATLALELIDGATLAPIASFTAELPGTWPGRPQRGRDGRLAWSGLRPYAAADDATFEDLPESPDLELTLQADGYDVALAPPLRLRTGETTDAGRLALRPLPFVHVRVTDAVDDAPLAGAECELDAILPERALGRTASRAVSDAEGRARLTVAAFNAADLLVRCRGYAPLRLRTPPANPAERPLEVALAPGGVLRVRVLDAERNPVRAQVLRRRTPIETGDLMGEHYERALTDADGWVEFTDLEAGPAAIAARALPRSDLELEPPVRAMAWTAVSVAMGGTSQVELGALPAHAVEVDLHWQGAPLPGAVLRLAADPQAFSAPHADAGTFLTGPALRADAEGRAHLGRLHAGLYWLRIEHPRVPGFARALLEVGDAGRRTLELASERLRGVVTRDGESVWEGRAVLWAHGPYYDLGLDVQPGDVLRHMVPEPIVLGEVDFADGAFDLAVPPGVELIVTARAGDASGDYFLALPEGPREAISVAIERSLELELTADLRGKRAPPRELGVVAFNRHHPWGRGLFAVLLEDRRLSLGDLPPGRWRMCLVELAGGQLVVERGDWIEFDLAGGPQTVRLRWRAR